MFDSLKANPTISAFFNSETLIRILFSAAYLLAGIILIRIIIFITRKVTGKKKSLQFRMIVDKVITYSGMTVLILVILAELGVNLAAILGAAGVFGIAIGVASQKSLGNMMSGLFLLSEKSFEIGDVVTVENKTGVVQDVDMLAVKIRTFDNMLIRIPNETIISTVVTNITRYPLRRLDFEFSVPYGTDLKNVEDLLRQVARANPLILDEPEPFFHINSFGRHGLELKIGMWFLKDDYVPARNSAMRDILDAFAAQSIEIPFDQITIHVAGNAGALIGEGGVPGVDIVPGAVRGRSRKKPSAE